MLKSCALLLCALIVLPESFARAQAEPLNLSDKAYLKRLQNATFSGFEKMRDPTTGIPVDIAPVSQGSIVQQPRSVDYSKTSPMHMALGFLYTVIARDRGFMTPENARRQAFRMMEIVEGLETHHDFLYNWYYLPGEDDRRPRLTTNRFIPSLDNAYLDAALMITATAFQDEGLSGMIDDFLARRNYDFFYHENSRGVPFLSAGYDVTKKIFSQEEYRILNHPARLLILLAVAKGDISKTVWMKQERLLKNYKTNHGTNIPAVISWAGSLYEVLFADELLGGYRIAPRSFGLNALNTLRIQKDAGRRISESGIWGFSEGEVPDQNRYLGAGVPEISYERSGARFATPYSTFLALNYFPEDALNNFRAMEKRNPAVFGMSYGFSDSIDPQTGVVNRNILGIHKGIEVLALGNFLNRLDGKREISAYLWQYFEENGMEKKALNLLKGEELQPVYQRLLSGMSVLKTKDTGGEPAASDASVDPIDVMNTYRDIGTFYEPTQAKAWHKIFPLEEGKQMIGVRYDVRKKYTYSGFYMKLRQTDLSAYHSFLFSIMGNREKGFPKNMKVELKWKGQNVQFDYVTLKEGWTDIELRLPKGPKNVDEVAFVFDNAQVGTDRQGEIFLQALRFN